MFSACLSYCRDPHVDAEEVQNSTDFNPTFEAVPVQPIRDVMMSGVTRRTCQMMSDVSMSDEQIVKVNFMSSHRCSNRRSSRIV